MQLEQTKVEGCFAGAAYAYAEFRPQYPAEIIQLITDKFSPNRRSNLLDIGCGSGLLSFQLCGFVENITAIDRDINMIEVAQKEAERLEITSIEFMHVAAEDLCTNYASYDQVVFGNSFHWLDRERLTLKLKDIILPKGGVSILTAHHIWHGGEAWKEVVRKTIIEFTGEDRTNGLNHLQASQSDSDYLQVAGFINIEKQQLMRPHGYSLTSLLGFLASTSYASRAKLGDKAEAFAAMLADRLKSKINSEEYVEQIKYELITAQLP